MTLNVFLSLLFLPGRIVEESLHALGAWPWAEWIRVEVDPQSGTAHTRVQYREGTPQWGISLAYLLPEAVAALSGAAVISWWALGGDVWLPATTLDWVLLSLFGAQWLAVALPSAADSDRTPEAGDGP
jgi:hypothetical protein